MEEFHRPKRVIHVLFALIINFEFQIILPFPKFDNMIDTLKIFAVVILK